MDEKEEKKYLYFWTVKDSDYGCFSQWFPCEFEEDGIIFSCTEQYMMAKKALLFGDISIYNKILSEDSPKKMKALGRKVKNFNPKIWENERYDIVLCANMLKFGYDVDLLKILRDTGDAVIAEASPYDKIWGIGVRKKKGMTESGWKGLNLLGKALMEVRKTI